MQKTLGKRFVKSQRSVKTKHSHIIRGIYLDQRYQNSLPNLLLRDIRSPRSMILINLMYYLMVPGRVRWLRPAVAGCRAACGGCGRVRAYGASTPVPAYRPAYVTPGAAGAPATARGSPEQVGLSSR